MKPIVPISVVIPCLNSERYLAEAIKSVHSQTVGVAEIIVVDNNCTDRTCEIAESLGARIVEQKKTGLPAARNAGVAACQNAWIAWLDSDDWWLPEKIEYQWEAVKTFPQSRIIFSYSGHFIQEENLKRKLFDENAEILGENLKKGRVKDAEAICCELLTVDLFKYFIIDFSNSLFHREVFSSAGLFDENILLAEEVEFFYRAMWKFPPVLIRKLLSYVRMHDSNMTRDQQMRWKSLGMAVEKMLKFPENYPPGCGDYHLQDLKDWFISRGISEIIARNAELKNQLQDSED